ncbi:endopeptidase La [Patescibacteria group bacterium]|nr:endopeptidase La [Patescibacteria group bacterium]
MEKKEIKHKLPLVPVRDVVIFPNAQVPISLKRDKSVKALEAALTQDKLLFLVMQKKKEVDNPTTEGLFDVGTISKVTSVQRLPDGVINISVAGEVKAKILSHQRTDPYFEVEVVEIPEPKYSSEEADSLVKPVVDKFRRIISIGKSIPLDFIPQIFDITNPYQTLDMLILNLDLKPIEKQALLEAPNLKSRVKILNDYLSRETSVLQTARKIQDQTSEEIGKSAREAFLREQLKTIEKELGVKEEREEFSDLEKKIKAAGMPKDTEEKSMKELDRLKRMPQFSPEVSYIRTYLDWLVEVPWSKKSESKIDIKDAEKILNQDHYGLKKVKERILEYLAVQKLTGKIKGPILCFVGPPGTGKTSVGRSIARALGRKFVKVSLGGIRDEAEIRGHRRTYVGALPGRIIQGMKDSQTKNPVFMMDEIDKVGYDFRGDPSSALLEALDPEQNHSFSDHYLEVPYDLSDVMFITTANVLDTIPAALRDRMEIIHFPGYTEEEKFHIATDYLWTKQVEIHGLSKRKIKMGDEVLKSIISKYTREAGVRNLERELASVCRKVAKGMAEKKIIAGDITKKNLHKYLGPEKFEPLTAEKKDEIGVATGLAVTEAGGEVLSVEVTIMPGKNHLILTGQLGDVMKESAQAALSYTRSNSSAFAIKENFFKEQDIHVHVPAGAIPKDGPSAGITMGTALVSLTTRIPVKKEVGMTGEITLRGKVLEIGGVKEKILAAHRAGLKKIILPRKNKKDLEEIPEKTRKELKFIFVDTMDEVLKNALTSDPFKPRPAKAEKPSEPASPTPLPAA